MVSMKKGDAARIEYPLAVQAAVALAALLSLWGSFEYSGLESAYQQQFHDPYQIAAQSTRFAQLQAAVPEQAILGYLTDADPGSILADAMFNGAQYALSPRLLQKNPALDLVLGNFTKPGDFAAIGRSHGLRVERDFGSGVVLFRKESS
jgi:hypothetical protein